MFLHSVHLRDVLSFRDTKVELKKLNVLIGANGSGKSNFVDTLSLLAGFTADSEAFFRSAEFQERGYFVYRFYTAALGRKPDFSEFTPDLGRVSGFLTNDQLAAAKTAFANDFTSRPAFAAQYNSLNNAAYVDALINTAAAARRQTVAAQLHARG